MKRICSFILLSIIGGNGCFSQTIAGGEDHSIAVCVNDTPQTWGRNHLGQLADGTTAGKLSPVKVIGITNITAVAAGWFHSIFLMNNGTVWTSGWNNDGELGDGTTTDKSTPVQVTGLTGITSIAGGRDASHFRRNDSTVWSCGLNNDGELGDASPLTTQATLPIQVHGPGNVGFLTGITKVAAGSYHALYLKYDGTAWSCGGNSSGQLGDGTSVDKNTPVQVSGLTNIVAIAGGRRHSLFVMNNGTVWACGENGFGQLGDGTNADKYTPVQVNGLTGIIAVAGGRDHSLFLKNDGTVWSCGRNDSAQLGDGTIIDKNLPVQVTGIPQTMSEVAAGWFHSLFRESNGTVWSCGGNNYGQLGDGTTVQKNTPVIVPGLISCNPTISVSVTGTGICTGVCATLNAVPNGGTAPFTYAWNPSGQTTSSIIVCPTSTTTYSVLITDAVNSTATDTAVVTINSAPVATVTSPTTICAGSSFTLSAGGGGNYSWATGSTASSIVISPSASTNYSVIVTNPSGCKDTATTTITVTPAINPTVTPQIICSGGSAVITASGGNTYSWNTGNTTSSITVSPTATTSYTVLVTAGSCTAAAVATVTVSTSITAAVSGNMVICLGSNTTLTASGGTGFSWSTGATSASITITPTSSGTYSVIVSSGTCADTASATVTVNPNPIPAISGNISICSGSSTTLTASGGSAYSWSTGATTGSITTSPTTTTNYSVIATDANGCTGITSVSITVNPNPTATITGNNILCIGNATTLTATGGGTYLWNTGATTSSIALNPSSTGNTAYTVTVTDGNGCTNSAGYTISVNQPPVANISGNNTICAGDNTTLTASGGGNYSWSTGQTSASINISPVSSANYSVVVSIGSCADTANYTVMVVPNPVAGAQSNVVINIGDATTLTATGGGTYSWVPSTGLSDPTISNPVASPGQTTEYCVYIMDAAGCIDSACVTVTVEINCKPIYIPNAFSPNGDGENDVLYVRGNCIEEMRLIIYNRWGEKVFETNDPKQGWDGTFRGTKENTAVFVYYMKAIFISGEKIIKKGNISLIR